MLKKNQYWIKVQYGKATVEIMEIWADDRNTAYLKAAKLAQSKLEFMIEEPKETDIRELENQLFALETEAEQLSEFIYDDYGDTVYQLGIKKTNELELDLSGLKDRCNEIKQQIQEIDQH